MGLYGKHALAVTDAELRLERYGYRIDGRKDSDISVIRGEGLDEAGISMDSYELIAFANKVVPARSNG